MKQSYLTNERIYLRAVEPEDMDIMYEMENDPSMWDISNFTVPVMYCANISKAHNVMSLQTSNYA